MIDPFVILAPFLLLPVIALFRFVGCAAIIGVDDVTYATPSRNVDVKLNVLSPSPLVTNKPLKFEARVVPQSATSSSPTRSVSFTEGAIPLFPLNILDTSSTTELIFTFDLTFASPGDHWITMRFLGDENYDQSSTQALVHLEPAPDFDFVLTSLGDKSAKAGKPFTFTFRITPLNGFNAHVSLASSAPPPTSGLNPPTFNPVSPNVSGIPADITMNVMSTSGKKAVSTLTITPTPKNLSGTTIPVTVRTT